MTWSVSRAYSVIRVHDDAGNVIETQEHKGDSRSGHRHEAYNFLSLCGEETPRRA